MALTKAAIQFDPQGETDPLQTNSTATGEVGTRTGLDQGDVTNVNALATADNGKGLDPDRWSTFWRFADSNGEFGIPAEATIISAILTTTSANASTFSTFEITYNLMPLDGLWELTGSALGWRSFNHWATTQDSHGWRFTYELRDDVAGVISSDTIAATIGGPTILRNEFMWRRVGYSVDTSAHGDLGAIDFTVKRFNTLSGIDVVCSVYAVTTPATTPITDASGLPTGAELAVSDVVSFDSLSTAGNGAVQTFTFSGADQITLSDNAYHFALRYADGDETINTANFFNMHGGVGSQVVPRGFWFGRAQGLKWLHYPIMRELPHRFNRSLSSKNTPLVSQVEDHPTQPVINTQYTHSDLATMFQAYIDLGGYDSTEPILLAAQATDGSAFRTFWTHPARQGDSDNPFLTVTYSLPTDAALVADATLDSVPFRVKVFGVAAIQADATLTNAGFLVRLRETANLIGLAVLTNSGFLVRLRETANLIGLAVLTNAGFVVRLKNNVANLIALAQLANVPFRVKLRETTANLIALAVMTNAGFLVRLRESANLVARAIVKAGKAHTYSAWLAIFNRYSGEVNVEEQFSGDVPTVQATQYSGKVEAVSQYSGDVRLVSRYSGEVTEIPTEEET